MKKVTAWFDKASNRRKVYQVARIVLPLLVAAGWVTSGESSTALNALSFVASFAVPHLAARHTPKENQ